MIGWANVVMGPKDPRRDVGAISLALQWANFVFARTPSDIRHLVLIYEPDISDLYEGIPIPHTSHQTDSPGDRVDVWKCVSLDEAQETFSKLFSTREDTCCLLVAR